ncbi:chorismate mutase [Nocardia sp. NPDC058058]|uniref:chorismate mutase n=1 Tax=Nocardia sp. NPDC058058 TaxID=3346317 RepID=UPI0036DB271A
MATPEVSVPIESIADGRARIDEIDSQLRELIAARRNISLDIQRHRLADGGPRIEHRRETQVLTSWSDELGAGGVDVARAVLGLCRGRMVR